LKHLVEGHVECLGDLKSHFEGRRVAALLDCDNGLSGNTNAR
jgi:hypothetical protein